MSKKIANTKRSGLSVAKVERNRIDTLYYQLIDLVGESGLGSEYENFFARPKDVPSEKSIDWYTELNGEVQQLTTLAPDQIETIYVKTVTMQGELKKYSEKLRSQGDKALNFPEKSYIYVVAGQPVITCWGFFNSEHIFVKDGDLTDTVNNRLKEEPEGDITGKVLESYVRPISDEEEEVVETIDDGSGVKKTRKYTRRKKSEAKKKETPEKPASEQEESKEAPTVVVNNNITQQKKRPWGIILLIVLLLLLVAAVAAWFFLNSKDSPAVTSADPAATSGEPSVTSGEDLSFLKGSFKAEGALSNENDELVDLEISIPNNDGTGESTIKTPSQSCKGSVSSSLGGPDEVLMKLGDIKCPNGNDFKGFILSCTKDRKKCTGSSPDGTPWTIEPTVSE